MPEPKNIIFIAILILTITIMSACNVKQHLPTCTKEGKAFCTIKGAFRDKWYDYYELGLSCTKGQCFDAAIESFQKAISKRRHDERMTRAYGMHIIDYFPHRELGICYYLIHDFIKAFESLERSIQQEPSAKAKFYLDEVRKQLFYSQKKQLTAPEITVHGLENNLELWTKQDPVIISGIAKDDLFIHKIAISDRLVFMDSASKVKLFEESFALSPGQHVIQVMAENLLGGITQKNVTVHIDRTGPMITLKKMLPFDRIEGILYDASGKMSLTANEIDIPLRKGQQVSFSIQWPSENDEMKIVARDKVNNQTTAVINSKMKCFQNMTHNVYFASNDSQNRSDTKPFALNTPKMNIQDWSDFNVVYTDRIELSGSIHSQQAIVSLRINEISLETANGQNIFFSKSLPLTKGMNTITVAAMNQSGQTIEKTFQFQRKIQEILKQHHRFKMKIYPFEQFDQKNVDESFYATLIGGLLNRNRFQIFFSDEIKGYGTFDFEMNRMRNISDTAFLKGMIDISKMGIDIVGRVFDANSKIIDYVDIYETIDQAQSLKGQLKQMAKRLSTKFHLAFPLVSGSVIKISHNQLTIQPQTWYHGKGQIRMNWPVIIYSSKNRHLTYPSETHILGNSKIQKIMEMNFGVQRVDTTATIGDGVITY